MGGRVNMLVCLWDGSHWKSLALEVFNYSERNKTAPVCMGCVLFFLGGYEQQFVYIRITYVILHNKHLQNLSDLTKACFG